MIIADESGLKLKCDTCRAPLVASAVPVVGFHGDTRIFHAGCVVREFQFLTASAARQMTLVAMFTELLQSVGLTAEDL